jgi:hypothetical protein
MKKVQLTPEAIMEIAKQNPEGFTVTMTGNSYTVGIAVATSLTQEAFGMEGIQKVIDVINNSGDAFNAIGGWYNAEDGQYYFDAVIVYDYAHMFEAYYMAIGEKQKAIYDIGKGIEISLKYPKSEADAQPETDEKSKVINSDGFLFLDVTEKAKEVFQSDCFQLYEIYDDGTEGMIDSHERLNETLEGGGTVAIEVGWIPA